MSRTSGSTAARSDAQKSLLLAAKGSAGALRRPLTSSTGWRRVAASHKPHWANLLSRMPLSFSPATLSRMDITGKGLARWKTMPTLRRTATGST